MATGSSNRSASRRAWTSERAWRAPRSCRRPARARRQQQRGAGDEDSQAEEVITGFMRIVRVWFVFARDETDGEPNLFNFPKTLRLPNTGAACIFRLPFAHVAEFGRRVRLRSALRRLSGGSSPLVSHQFPFLDFGFARRVGSRCPSTRIIASKTPASSSARSRPSRRAMISPIMPERRLRLSLAHARAAALVKSWAPTRILDLATGSGDLALALVAPVPRRKSWARISAAHARGGAEKRHAHDS